MPGVVFVSYAGPLGGAERALLEWAGAVEDRGVLACPAGALATAARARGLAVLALPARALQLRGGARTTAAAGRALVAHALDVRRLAASLEPELFVACGMRSALACAVTGVRFAFDHHDLVPAGPVGAVVRRAAGRAALVVVPSQTIADDLGDVGVPVAVVPPGVDIDRLGVVATGAPVQDPPVVLVLGALTRWKRPDLALEIVAAARREVPALRLRVVGAPVTAADAELVAALRARAAAPDLAGAVELPGSIGDVREELARATCLLHCAPREPFGLVVAEAMASGRPVVVPAACGPAEIADGTCGVLYPPGDVAAAARAVVELARDRSRAAALGSAGRRRAVSELGTERSRQQFAAALGRLGGVGERGGDPRPAGNSRPAPEPQRLTLVTVTHDSAPELAALLRCAARRLPGVGVVVVDNGSRDDTVAVAQSHPGTTVIALGGNIGFARACNRGLNAVGTPAAALVNPDVELLDDSLLTLAGEALRDDRPPRLLAPRVLDGDGGIQDTAHPRPGSLAELVRCAVPPALVPGRPGRALAPWRSAAPRRVGWAVGCALVARTATLRALGPFDTSFFLYGEDLELGLRARREGIETWLWPAARVVHHRAHASDRAFGGEPFGQLARARHDAVARGRGPRWARLDDGGQVVTFATRIAVRRALGRSAQRERRQLAAARALPGS